MKTPPAHQPLSLDWNRSRHAKHSASSTGITPQQLSQLGHHRGKSASAGDTHAQVTEKTQQWVAQTFFGTLLKQMDDSPFKSEMFSGGRGGQAFSALYHQRLVEHMGRATGSKLVNSLVRKIEAKRAYDQQKTPKQQKVNPAASKGGADIDHLLNAAKSQGLRRITPTRRPMMNLAA